jgi:fumarate reductase flavoprotein subunit
MPVKPAAGKPFEYSVPVVVVGAGAGGLTAALAARDGGAEVLLLERDHTPRGSTSMSQGNIAAAGTKSQAAAGIDDSGKRFGDDIVALARGETDVELAYAFAAASGPTVDWLTEKHNVPLEVDLDWGAKLGHSCSRIHATPSKTGTELMSCLMNACDAAGVDLITDAHVVDVYADEDGTVRGVRFERPDGSDEEVGCGALVLTTCGFGANRDMIRKFIPDMGEALYHGHEGNEGEGIRWGMELGAATADMTAFQGLGALAEPSRVLIHYNAILNGGIVVNVNGDRFTDETTDISGMGRKVTAQPEHYVWFIFDQKRQDFVLKYEEHKEAMEVGAVKKADTLEKLSQITKVPAKALQKTLDGASAMQNGKGKDPHGRDFASEEPLEGPPWYVVKSVGALFHTQGGLVIDANAQVQRENGSPLPNLFAAGGTARSTSGPSDWGYIPAAGLFTATTQGRLAGEAAARTIASAKQSAAAE